MGQIRWSVRRVFLFIGALLFIFGGRLAVVDAAPSAEADQAWQVVLQQATGPGTRFHDQGEALAAARKHLDAQESMLRGFIRLYPDDPRAYSARIRLSSVLSAKGRLQKQPAFMTEAQKLLTDLEADPATPPSVKADAAFARVSSDMENLSGGPINDAARDGVLKTIRQFDTSYPDDRRTPGLLTEIATLYDELPAQKKALLEEAAMHAKDEGLRNRIHDDLKRVSLLGRPLDLSVLPWQGGAPVKLADARGRVVVVLFWASWSMPALHELARLKDAAAEFQGQPVDFWGISLDEDRAAMEATVKAADIRWPIQCDGRGWKGELVRSLGINALPTTWVFDRRGQLTMLNARGQASDAIREALAAK